MEESASVVNRESSGTQQHGDPTSQDSLRRIGRIAATLLTAAMIIGTGIFGALGDTADHAGSALLLAMVPGALVAWSTGVSGAQLGVNFPQHGGAFVANTYLAWQNGHRSQFAESLRLSEANDAVREHANLYSRAVGIEGTSCRIRTMGHIALRMRIAERAHRAR